MLLGVCCATLHLHGFFVLSILIVDLIVEVIRLARFTIQSRWVSIVMHILSLLVIVGGRIGEVIVVLLV